MRQLKIFNSYTRSELFPYLKTVTKRPLSEEEEFRAALDKDWNKLVEHNLLFVVSVAKVYSSKNHNLNIMDLVQAGNVGLIKAAQKFDPSRGFKFISYAVAWIRQSILEYINTNSDAVRIPSNRLAEIQKSNKEFIEEYEQYGMYKNPKVHTLLLNDKVGDDSDSNEIVDLMSSDNDTEFTELDKKQFYQTLEECIDRYINPRYRNLMLQFIRNPNISRSELAINNNLTVERVRQIMVNSFDVIKRECPKLKDYLYLIN